MSNGELFIGGEWVAGEGPAYKRADPALGDVTWEGRWATPAQVNAAVHAARRATAAWASLTVDQRAACCEAFAKRLDERRAELAQTIARETGKPLWESRTEIDAMIAKVAISRKAVAERRSDATRESADVVSATRFKPHGVMAVLGPFNFPGHLPNGHIVPALLAGNTVVFKPSELAPRVAALTAECWHEAGGGGLPAGVINLVHGGREIGAALAGHAHVDGVLLTGSHAAGVALSKLLADHPEKILALEMGGNNPLVVARPSNLDAAVYAIVQSAFLTAGQRCTCARRLIVLENEAQPLLARLADVTRRISVGPFTQTPEPFMGPLITAQAAAAILAAHDDCLRRGAQSLVPVRKIGDAMLTPGILDVTHVSNHPDEELFGPLLQVIRVPDFDAALLEANRTRYGLVAGLLSADRALYDRFYAAVRCGVVNWNRPTTGASSSLPFGGIGWSGNHRPSAYFAADYCSYPVAATESPMLELPKTLAPGITL